MSLSILPTPGALTSSSVPDSDDPKMRRGDSGSWAKRRDTVEETNASFPLSVQQHEGKWGTEAWPARPVGEELTGRKWLEH